MPGWCESAALTVNGQAAESRAAAGSYVVIERDWKPGNVVALDLPMPARPTAPHPQIDALRGSLAIERGPLVYCLEEIDQEPGLNLAAVRISPASALRPTWRGDLLGGVTTIEAEGALADLTGWAEHLYRPQGAAEAAAPHRAATLTAVPYYAWANRGPGKMRVWLPVG